MTNTVKEPPVKFTTLNSEASKTVGVITLNSAKTLNSLSLEMIDLISDQLKIWRQDSSIACVFMHGAGEKAFCAGGDIQQLYHSMQEAPTGPNHYAQQFFEQEYRLDYLIHNYGKPIILWGNGIVMGGGLGLMAGASHRIVTETSRIAMPEISIGLFPDVGASWFLNQMPGQIGLYLALTASSINAADAIYSGIADCFIQSSLKDSLLTALGHCSWDKDSAQDYRIVTTILDKYQSQSKEHLPESKLEQYRTIIDQVTDHHNLIDIVHDIKAIESDDKWLVKGAKALSNGSATTAHIIFQQLKRGKRLSLKDVFKMEYILANRCATFPDFAEGVRALLIDKDNLPKWKYQLVENVPTNWVESHFEPLWDTGENHPLHDL